MERSTCADRSTFSFPVRVTEKKLNVFTESLGEGGGDEKEVAESFRVSLAPFSVDVLSQGLNLLSSFTPFHLLCIVTHRQFQ